MVSYPSDSWASCTFTQVMNHSTLNHAAQPSAAELTSRPPYPTVYPTSGYWR